MEIEKTKTIYFLYTQNGQINNINSFVRDYQVNKLFDQKCENSIKILYEMKIPKNKEENKIRILLQDTKSKIYSSSVSLNYSELIGDDNIDIYDYIFFNIRFNPCDKKANNDLDQFILPYDEQFYFFEEQFKNKNKTLTNLYISTIFQVLINVNQKFSFILDFFFKIYKNKSIKTIVMKCFFKHMKNILRNCDFALPENIEEKYLDKLKNSKKIKSNIISIIKETNLEENVDLFLSYYYILCKNKKLFIEFINNKERKEKIIKALIDNRNLFKNFTREIITSDIINITENKDELLSLLKLYPNVIDCFKIVENFEILFKFQSLILPDQKDFNSILIQKQKKSDNIGELYEVYMNIIQNIGLGDTFPFVLEEDFLFHYYNLFEADDESFNKIITIIKILIDSKLSYLYKLHNKTQILKTNEIFYKFFDKGTYLLKNKKLKNLNFVEFLEVLKRIPKKIFKVEKGKPIFAELYKHFHLGIEFDGKDKKFLDNVIKDEYKFRDWLGDSYDEFVAKIFDKFIKPKDLLVLITWDLDECTAQIFVKVFLETIKRIWINYPENYMYGLTNLFAREFAAASKKIDKYQAYLDEIEKKIDKEKIMEIYSEILIKKFTISEEFEKHMKKYILEEKKETPKIIYFKMCTYDKEKRADMIKPYLNKNFAVKFIDFVHYPYKIEERIYLFTKLKKSGIIPSNFKDSDYYKNSMNSKNELEKMKFKDATEMSPNMDKIRRLLQEFFIDSDESVYLSYLTAFRDKMDEAIKFYDQLKLVQNYWVTFFPLEKQGELKKLEKSIKEFENKEIGNCTKKEETKKHDSFLNSLSEAEKGKILQNSIIFMEFYEKFKNEGGFNLSLKNFEKLKELNFNLEELEKDLKNCIIDAVYKNIDLLDEELNFIKEYFQINEGNNFDTKMIRNNIINLVKKKQEELGVYRINFEEKFKLDLEPDESIDEEETFEIKNKIRVLYESYIYNSKTFGNIQNNNEIESLNKSLEEFYKKLFDIGMKFVNIPLKIIYEDIIILSDKIFFLTKNLGISDNIIGEQDFSLIAEFNFIIQILKKYRKVEKNLLVTVFTIFNKLYIDYIKNQKDNEVKSTNSKNLFEILQNNLPRQELNNIIVEIFVYELKKLGEKESIRPLIDLLQTVAKPNDQKNKNKNTSFYKDLIPFIDLIFKIDIETNMKNGVEDLEHSYPEINKTYINNGYVFEEMLLFYLENKFIKKIDINKHLEIFEKCIEYLVDQLKSNDSAQNKDILKIISITFIKCFLYKYIHFIYTHPEIKNAITDIFQFGNKQPKSFSNSLKLYVLKLIFHEHRRLFDLNDQIYKLFNIEIHQIEINNIHNNDLNKKFGFDYLFIPVKENNNCYELIKKRFSEILSDKYNITEAILADNEIKEVIENNIDILFCIMANFHFSFCYDRKYFENHVCRDLGKLFDELKEKINILKNNESIKNIFIYFNVLKEGNKIYKNYIAFYYEQLLSLLISARFILSTISSKNVNSLFYNMITNPGKKINGNTALKGSKYYLKEFNIYIIDTRKITFLTYEIINYIILSHIFFGFQLKKISIEDIKSVFNSNNLKNENDVRDFLLEKLFNTFNNIKNNLLPLLGINNVIVFMNSIYKNFSKQLIDIKLNIKEEEVNNNEQSIDSCIRNVIYNYRKSIDEYYEFVDNSNNINLVDILVEKPSLYNDIDLERYYPYFTFFTYNNYIDLYDDFKNQYIYYYYDSLNYPFISSYFPEEDNIFNIIEYIPKLNQFSNIVYDKLNIKYSKKDITEKKIKEVFHDELNKYINEFNEFIEKNKEVFDINNKIDRDSTLMEIINLPGSKLNVIYSNIIKMYNNYIEKMKVPNNFKDIIDKVIIQEAKENDYNFKYILKNGNKITVGDKINELIFLYSYRNRKEEDKLNVYNGGKIEYKFDIIENKLEEYFIFGKKFFDDKQKLFIFYDDIFEKERNIFNEFKNKYQQEELSQEKNKNLEEYFEKNIENTSNIFYEILLLFNYMLQKEFDFNLKKEENFINNILKYFELKSYNFPKLSNIRDLLNNNVSLNTLLDFYEKVEKKAFNDLTGEIKEKNQNLNLDEDIKDKIQNVLKENEVISEIVLFNAFRKYILRYVKNKENDLIKTNDLVETKNIWEEDQYGTTKFKEEWDNLFKLDNNGNDEENCIIKYCFIEIYGLESSKDQEDNDNNNEKEDDIYG